MGCLLYFLRADMAAVQVSRARARLALSPLDMHGIRRCMWCARGADGSVARRLLAARLAQVMLVVATEGADG